MTTVTITSSACPGAAKRAQPFGERQDLPTARPEERAINLPGLKAFAASQISSGCSCLKLAPKTTTTATVMAATAVRVISFFESSSIHPLFGYSELLPLFALTTISSYPVPKNCVDVHNRLQTSLVQLPPAWQLPHLLHLLHLLRSARSRVALVVQTRTGQCVKGPIRSRVVGSAVQWIVLIGNVLPKWPATTHALLRDKIYS